MFRSLLQALGLGLWLGDTIMDICAEMFVYVVLSVLATWLEAEWFDRNHPPQNPPQKMEQAKVQTVEGKASKSREIKDHI